MGADIYLNHKYHTENKICEFCRNEDKSEVKGITFNCGAFYACPKCCDKSTDELWVARSKKIESYGRE